MFLSATIFSFVATQLFVYSAIVYFGTVQPAYGALFYSMCFLPFLIFSKPLGKMSDRYRRLPVVISAHIIMSFVFFTTWVMLNDDQVSLQKVLICGMSFGASFIFLPSFRYALIADFFPPEKQPEKLMFFNIVAVVSLSVAPMLHLLTEYISSHAQFYIASLLMAFATILYALSGKQLQEFARASNGGQTRSLSSSGKRFGKEEPPKFDSLTMLFCILGVLMLGPLQSIVPGIISSILNNNIERDLVMVMLGIGLILSSPFLGYIKSMDRTRASFGLSIFVSISTMALAFSGNILQLSISILFSGIFAGALVNWNQSIMQMSVPQHQQGQFMSTLAFINMGVPAMASFVLSGANSFISSQHSLLLVPAFIISALIVYMLKMRFVNRTIQRKEA